MGSTWPRGIVVPPRWLPVWGSLEPLGRPVPHGEIERGEVTVTIVAALKLARPLNDPVRTVLRPEQEHRNSGR